MKQKTIQIGGTDYTIQQLPATKGLEVTFAIAQILKGLAEGVSEEFVFSFEETSINIGKMIAGIISETDIKGTPEFIKNVVMESTIKPDMDNDLFETHFAGNYEELADLLSEIIQFNKFHELIKKNALRFIDILQDKG